MHNLEVVGGIAFDYSIVTPGARTHLRQYASRLSSLAQSAAVGLWEMGHILSEAQERLASYGNGTFQRWLEGETALSLTTAYRLLNVYKAFSRDTLSEVQIATSALYVLAEPSTPPEARQEALSRAKRGETVTRTTATAIVEMYRPPETDPLQEFERTELLPRLHDAGNPAAPQMLSGKQAEPQPVPEELRQKAEQSMRSAIIEAIRDLDTSDKESVEACADELVAIMGQNVGNLAIAARFGTALSSGPKTLSDLTGLAIWACDECKDTMDRDAVLAWRKRVLRVIDSITWCGGLPIYEHKLDSGQLVYSLRKWREDS